MITLEWKMINDGTFAAKVEGGTVLHVPTVNVESRDGNGEPFILHAYPGGIVFIPDPPVELIGLVGEFDEVES